jgi:hypothetical protein
MSEDTGFCVCGAYWRCGCTPKRMPVASALRDERARLRPASLSWNVRAEQQQRWGGYLEPLLEQELRLGAGPLP